MTRCQKLNVNGLAEWRETTVVELSEGKKGRRSRAEARQEILDRAVDFLWDHSFREMTVARLMDRTSIGRSAFYVYFRDTAHLAEALLGQVQTTLEQAISPWVAGVGEPVTAMCESLRGEVEASVRVGPIMRAVSEAAATDAHLERLWNDFLEAFDRAVEQRLRAEQRAGRVGPLDAAATARAMNRLDAAYLIDSFGRHPQADPDQVHKVLATIWISTVYGREKLDEILYQA
ncbi:MAG: TetR/AcrR family transcriptional regulator [Phycisphaerales bacterium]|nr:MAG: TetR/AcrR family transcriptional regulator [Phycisphaerales bacterium]